jgi:hypothetical protein
MNSTIITVLTIMTICAWITLLILLHQPKVYAWFKRHMLFLIFILALLGFMVLICCGFIIMSKEGVFQ